METNDMLLKTYIMNKYGLSYEDWYGMILIGEYICSETYITLYNTSFKVGNKPYHEIYKVTNGDIEYVCKSIDITQSNCVKESGTKVTIIPWPKSQCCMGCSFGEFMQSETYRNSDWLCKAKDGEECDNLYVNDHINKE